MTDDVEDKGSLDEPVAPPAGAGGPAEVAPPQPTGPLTPVFLVWPGKTFSQTWVFMWIGVAFIVAGMLPWHTSRDLTLIASNGTTMAAVDVLQDIEIKKAGATGMEMVPTFIGHLEPHTPGALLVLIMGVGLVLTGFINIWCRKLIFWPVTLALFVVLATLWWTSSTIPSPGHYAPDRIGAFATFGETVGSIGGLFKESTAPEYKELAGIAGRFGVGVWVALLAWVAMVIVIVGSLIIAIITSKRDQPGAAPARSGGGRPGRRPPGRR